MPRPLPPGTDPVVAALVAHGRRAARARRAASAGLSRRQFLLGAAGTAGTAALLAACGTGGGTPGAGGTSGGGGGAGDALRWANWTLYLDQDDAGGYPTLQAFTEQSGIEVEYSEDVDDNDTFYGKVQGQLANGQDIGYDLVTLTDWMAARWIRMGYAQTLDREAMPNTANILPGLADVDFDPGRTHSLTWQSGFGGLAWDTEKVPGGMATVSDLWNPEYRGRIEVLSEMRDTIGLIMAEQGVDIAGPDWGDAEFGAALEVLREQIANGQIRQVRGNSYAQDLVSGDAVAVIGWSGDVTALNFENDGRFGFAIPESGGTLWSDNLLVPTPSSRVEDAQTLIDHYYDPVVAAQVAAYVNYITPVQGAQEAMADVDPSLVEEQLIFPDEATLSQVKVFRTLTPEEEERYNRDFLDVIGA
ncbi:polyamine ABC transporter substrate-binding protein [Cellulomonas marina]|uniref:Spermidine/putrescine transport system substrate-binding protein n=1 Tax=Cellulomonas marina TaxID=988821 RepID=A0A1I0VI24_9CELL|nr:spermidine/putrescine ABC transporter substrate-binding protein [Cellulomonas marina]GIG27991.1 ABC transporter substrate-binding protein [Cellulomonas marina]SFA75206.1 spermidine/putrescine transport system substrate-binding protein [Cellulomonas marina]